MPPQAASPTTDPSVLMLAYLCIKDIEPLNDRVAVLDRFGLADDQIAQVCQVAVGSVRNARLALRKAKSSSKPATKKKAK
jgi:hypothetical protein